MFLYLSFPEISPASATFSLLTAATLPTEEKKRETAREVGGSERHYRGGREKNSTSVLKVPRHFPFVLLVSAKH
jgi:hypothetical protein